MEEWIINKRIVLTLVAIMTGLPEPTISWITGKSEYVFSEGTLPAPRDFNINAVHSLDLAMDAVQHWTVWKETSLIQTRLRRLWRWDVPGLLRGIVQLQILLEQIMERFQKD